MILMALGVVAVPAGAVRAGGAAADGLDAGYRVLEVLALPGPTRWDYLTLGSAGRRLFITRGERVDVLDLETRTVVGTIAGTHGVHGVALASEAGKGFISDGLLNAVTVFDLATLAPLAIIPTGTEPDAMVYDAASGRVFAANGGGGTLTVIEAGKGTVTGTISLDGLPEFAVVDGKRRLYVNLGDKSQLEVVDTAAMKVLVRYDLAPGCQGPTGLAIDADRDRLFAVCRNKAMVVVDGATGAILETLPIGGSPDAAAFDPETGLAFSSNGDGTLTVVGAAGPDHYRVVQTVPTRPTARTMALDPATHRIYLAAAETDGFDPPTENHPHPRPHLKPESFMILTVGPGESRRFRP
jgi:DNA-binding beta-propeller fold protein YncE